MKPVAILGCGPAGMMAAHAVAHYRQQITILSLGNKSKIGGAQFLHRSIPGLTNFDPDGRIRILSRGNRYSYMCKVYGEYPVPFVSFPESTQEQDAWSLQVAYDRLWDLYSDLIHKVQISPQWLDANWHRFDLIFNTVPLHKICLGQTESSFKSCAFHQATIKIHPGEYVAVPDNTIVYDGTDQHSWYRASSIFGQPGVEWSTKNGGPPPGLKPIMTDHKPIATNCDCWPTIIRLGRRGTWTKGVLTHQAFEKTKEVMDALL